MKKKVTVEEQTKQVKRIMGKGAVIPEYRFIFGKHMGFTLEHVYKGDRDYLLWCYHNDIKLPVRVIEFIESEVL